MLFFHRKAAAFFENLEWPQGLLFYVLGWNSKTRPWPFERVSRVIFSAVFFFSINISQTKSYYVNSFHINSYVICWFLDWNITVHEFLRCLCSILKLFDSFINYVLICMLLFKQLRSELMSIWETGSGSSLQIKIFQEGKWKESFRRQMLNSELIVN